MIPGARPTTSSMIRQREEREHWCAGSGQVLFHLRRPEYLRDLAGPWRPPKISVAMTITYSDGSTIEALLLAYDESTVRAIAPADDDVRVFRLSDGEWVSTSGEPVAIQFAWESCGDTALPSVGECVCSKELAMRLISTLRSKERDQFLSGTIFELSPEGGKVRIQTSVALRRRLARRTPQPGKRRVNSAVGTVVTAS